MTAPLESVDWRTERARIVGWLARRYGDLDLAEEATQEAFEAAAAQWPTAAPDRPGAWLHTVAHRRAIAAFRRRRPAPTDAADVDDAGPHDRPAERPGPDRPLGDDLFALLCTCCHPALATEHQIALTLRHVCGLTVEEIAAAFLVAEQTMAKRLVRARTKIRVAGIPIRTPDREGLDERVDAIRAVIYLTFNEGYLSHTDAAPAVRSDLCDEAVWLARHLATLHPDPESQGLLALLLVQHARRDARVDGHGALVRLTDQDRGRWDDAAIAEAREVLSTAQDGTIGRYRVEAAIALLHVSGSGPDWPRIADLHGLLARLVRTPVADVHHAHALGMADGARAGLAALELIDAAAVAEYAPYHAVRADLLQQAGEVDAARGAWSEAAQHARHPAERAALLERVAGVTNTSVQPADDPPVP